MDLCELDRQIYQKSQKSDTVRLAEVLAGLVKLKTMVTTNLMPGLQSVFIA